jgi:hypothetical protein
LSTSRLTNTCVATHLFASPWARVISTAITRSSGDRNAKQNDDS